MASEFKPTVGKKVSRKEAKEWIDKYKKERKKDTTSVFYGRDTILQILKDPSIAGISFFFCRKPNERGQDQDDLVLIGTRADGTLALSDSSMKDGDDDGMGTFNNGVVCPPACPTGDI